MKKVLTLIAFVGVLFAGSSANAQSFTVAHDTMIFSANGYYSADNHITNTSAIPDTIQWKVATTNWPADWMATIGVCDNVTCYDGTAVWPTAIKEAIYPVGVGDFHMTLDMSIATTPGTYVMRIRFNNKHHANDTAWQTYILTRTAPPAAVNKVKAISTDVKLYPNPASSTLNVVYDAGADIKNVAIYSIIGRQMNMFRATDDNSASLNIENLPSGVYFVRLLNSNGDVFATRKFTKQ